MTQRNFLKSKIEQVGKQDFEQTALEVFRWQARRNPLFFKWLKLLGKQVEQIQRLEEIPFLPIQFFKNHEIKTGNWQPKTEFSSSGTTGQAASHHSVRDLDFYLKNARHGFFQFYGDPADWCFLALLPNYLERGGSSLVAMAADFIQKSRHGESGFFLHDFQNLKEKLERCRDLRVPTVLLGVSFALLDFAEQMPMDLGEIVVMETGGMKGRRRELTRPELHQILCKQFKIKKIHSEYGMTELFSQAYSAGGEEPIFRPAATMRVLATEANDPFCLAKTGKTGTLNIVDLANLDTCSFIATEDLGRVFADGSFEVLGRLDAAELRGCNLMVE